MANDEKPVEKALMTSSSDAITSQDGLNSNLGTIMTDSGASGHFFDDVIIHGLKHRLQEYVHLATPRKILTAERAPLDGTAEGVPHGLVTSNYGTQILVRDDIVVVPGIGHNLFSVITAAKNGIIVAIFDYEKPRLKGIDTIVPLRSESGDLYSFVLDSSADGYGAKELQMKAVANAQVWHQQLGHLHARSFQLCYGGLIESFTPVAIGGYKYVSKVTDKCTKRAAVYLLTNKIQALQSLQLFVGSTVIPFGGHTARWRDGKDDKYTREEFPQYCLKTGTIQELTATNTPQRNGMSDRVGRTLCAMVWYMLADGGFLLSMWGELFMATAYLKNRTPHKALKMETSFKMLHDEKADLSHLRGIVARTFEHIEDS